MKNVISIVFILSLFQSIAFSDDTYVILKKNNIEINEESLIDYLKLYTKDGLKDTLDKLIKDLGSESFKVREKATEKLIGIGPQAQDAIKKASNDEDLEIAHRAIMILHIISKNKASMDALPVRAAAITALGILKSKSAVPVIAEILKTDESVKVRLESIKALGEIGDETATKVISERIRKETNLEIQLLQISLISILDRKIAIDHFKNMKSFVKNRKVMEKICEEIRKMRSREAFDILLSLSSDSNTGSTAKTELEKFSYNKELAEYAKELILDKNNRYSYCLSQLIKSLAKSNTNNTNEILKSIVDSIITFKYIDENNVVINQTGYNQAQLILNNIFVSPDTNFHNYVFELIKENKIPELLKKHLINGVNIVIDKNKELKTFASNLILSKYIDDRSSILLAVRLVEYVKDPIVLEAIMHVLDNPNIELESKAQVIRTCKNCLENEKLRKLIVKYINLPEFPEYTRIDIFPNLALFTDDQDIRKFLVDTIFNTKTSTKFRSIGQIFNSFENENFIKDKYVRQKMVDYLATNKNNVYYTTQILKIASAFAEYEEFYNCFIEYFDSASENDKNNAICQLIGSLNKEGARKLFSAIVNKPNLSNNFHQNLFIRLRNQYEYPEVYKYAIRLLNDPEFNEANKASLIFNMSVSFKTKEVREAIIDYMNKTKEESVQLTMIAQYNKFFEYEDMRKAFLDMVIRSSISVDTKRNFVYGNLQSEHKDVQDAIVEIISGQEFNQHFSYIYSGLWKNIDKASVQNILYGYANGKSQSFNFKINVMNALITKFPDDNRTHMMIDSFFSNKNIPISDRANLCKYVASQIPKEYYMNKCIDFVSSGEIIKNIPDNLQYTIAEMAKHMKYEKVQKAILLWLKNSTGEIRLDNIIGNLPEEDKLLFVPILIEKLENTKNANLQKSYSYCLQRISNKYFNNATEWKKWYNETLNDQKKQSEQQK